MAQQLGGIYDGGEGTGAGMAQVFKPAEYKVPDIAGAFQKGQALAQKKQAAEDKAKLDKAKLEKKGKEDYFHPIDYIIKEEGKRVAVEYQQKHEEDPIAADEWLLKEKMKIQILRENKGDYEKLVTKKGQSLSTQPADQIENLQNLKTLENGGELYKVFQEEGSDPYKFLGRTASMTADVRKKEPIFSLQEHTRKNLPIIKTQAGINLIEVPDLETGGKKQIAVSDFTTTEADVVAKNIILDPKAYSQVNKEYREENEVEDDVAIEGDALSDFYAKKYLYPLVNKYTKQKTFEPKSGGSGYEIVSPIEGADPNVQSIKHIGTKNGQSQEIVGNISFSDNFTLSESGGVAKVAIPVQSKNRYNANTGEYETDITTISKTFIPNSLPKLNYAEESFEYSDGDGNTIKIQKGQPLIDAAAVVMKESGKKVGKKRFAVGTETFKGRKGVSDRTVYYPYEDVKDALEKNIEGLKEKMEKHEAKGGDKSELPMINSKAEFDELPSGAKYTKSDGKTYQKK